MWHFQIESHLASYPYDQNITKEKCQTISSVALFIESIMMFPCLPSLSLLSNP